MALLFGPAYATEMPTTPNRPDDREYILHLIGQVITVSLETVQIVKSLPEFILADKAGAVSSGS